MNARRRTRRSLVRRRVELRRISAAAKRGRRGHGRKPVGLHMGYLRKTVLVVFVLFLALILLSCKQRVGMPAPSAPLPSPSLPSLTLVASIECLKSDRLFKVEGSVGGQGVWIEIKILDNRQGGERIVEIKTDGNGNFETNIEKFWWEEVVVVAKDSEKLNAVSNSVELDYMIDEMTLSQVNNNSEYEVLVKITNTGSGNYSSYVECDAFFENESSAEWFGTFEFSLEPGESTTGVCRDRNGNNLTLEEDVGDYTIMVISEPGSFDENEEYQPSEITPDIIDEVDEDSYEGDIVWIQYNKPPRFSPIEDFVVEDGSEITFDIDANDPDGDELTYSVVNLPEGASFDEDTGIFYWEPECDQTGVYDILFEVRDGNFIVGETVRITVVLEERSVRLCKEKLLVEGESFTMKGVGYHPVPIGHDGNLPPYGDYFTHVPPDDDYSGIYERDLPLIRDMNANTIRLWGWNTASDHTDFLDQAYNGGDRPIYVIAGFWIDHADAVSVDYLEEIEKYENGEEGMVSRFLEIVTDHKDHPAILMWSIGSNVNEALGWTCDDVPPAGGGDDGDGGIPIGGCVEPPPEEDWYTLLNYMARLAHEEEGNDYHPVTTVNEEILNIADYDDLVPDLDVWGATAHRGESFGNLFSDYTAMSSKPFWVADFGVDVWNTEDPDDPCSGFEDEPSQASIDAGLWDEIAANSNVAIGGSLMTYSDEWWTAGGRDDAHGCGGSVDESGQPDGFENNEWWGVMRITDDVGIIDLVEPREAYFTLQQKWQD